MAKRTKAAIGPRGYKSLKCKYCNNISERVDNNATAITCWKCTQRLVNGEELELRK